MKADPRVGDSNMVEMLHPTGRRFYEVRSFPSADSLSNFSAGIGWSTFSVGIGEAVPEGRRKPAAIYRVRGYCDAPDKVKALAERLVHWLNHPERDDAERCPVEIPWSNDGAARIILTAAGRAHGWLPAGGAR